MPQWVPACKIDDIELEDVKRFDFDGETYIIIRSPDDKFYATDGLCTHEKVHLSEGLVFENTIECPKHNGSFDYTTGEALVPPVCIHLKKYPVRVDGDTVLIDVSL
ncbi:MAG: Rieske 2Fe-2S domain-containing protein [Rhizobiaceae bacterium]|nr:Rieske 2Fe-2S domain-containing protein [Rhizobiaceae bacterium]